MAGYYAFFWIIRQGFYALALPGALLGLGCGYLSGRMSNVQGAVCAVAAVALALYIEWVSGPFIDDASLSYFLMHLHKLTGLTQIMVVLSGVFGFWFGRGNRHNQRAAEA